MTIASLVRKRMIDRVKALDSLEGSRERERERGCHRQWLEVCAGLHESQETRDRITSVGDAIEEAMQEVI